MESSVKTEKELKGVWHDGKDRDLTFKGVSDSAKLVPPVPIDGDWEGVFDKEGCPERSTPSH